MSARRALGLALISLGAAGCRSKPDSAALAPSAGAEPARSVATTPVTASAAALEPEPTGEDNCCMGKNSCKGKGGCGVPESHACAGQNDCRAKGGCRAHCPK